MDGGGFVIASTSIDDLCEIKGGPGDIYIHTFIHTYIFIFIIHTIHAYIHTYIGGKRLEFVEEPSNGDSSFAGLDNYIRTTLKLAGYTIHTYIIRSDISAQMHYPKVKYTTIYMIYIHTYIQYIRTFINKPTSIHKYINIHTHIHA